MATTLKHTQLSAKEKCLGCIHRLQMILFRFVCEREREREWVSEGEGNITTLPECSHRSNHALKSILLCRLSRLLYWQANYEDYYNPAGSCLRHPEITLTMYSTKTLTHTSVGHRISHIRQMKTSDISLSGCTQNILVCFYILVSIWPCKPKWIMHSNIIIHII